MNCKKGRVCMTIAEVSQKYDISSDTLRYYERIGLLPPVPRNKSGIRDFDEDSCRWIELIKCMRSAGMSLEALIEYVTLYQQGPDTFAARRELLAEQRKLLLQKQRDIEAAITRLDHKIELYDTGLMSQYEKKSD